jgi:predicted TIM-barrel fold metal-dependent hydrolase
MPRAILTILSIIALTSARSAAQSPDTALLREIEAIRAIDSHAHPIPASRAGDTDEFDPPQSVPPLGPPALLRLENPAWRKAWRALYGYSADSLDPARIRSLKLEARSKGGVAWARSVLDKLNIETMLANRHTMGPGLEPPRFRLVWFVDPLVFPLKNESAKSLNPQRRSAYDTEEAWLSAYMKEQSIAHLPSTLDDYLNRVVIPAMEKRKRDGAVAFKLSISYQRDLRVGNPSRAEAGRVYRQYVHNASPPESDYRALQDFLIREIARQCGKIGLPLQIHVGAGSGPSFDNAGADPFLLMPMLLDTALRRTTFVLVHGGFPSAAATRVLFAKPNVFVDFSSQAFLSSTRELSEVLRKWLEFRPEKVMFGTDAYSIRPEIGWEEVAWMTNESSRRALAIALTGMIEDGEIDRTRAFQVARMVLSETARSVYGLSH